jgi:hypothetical protein
MNRKTEPASALATVLTSLSKEYTKVENVASGMLAILKTGAIQTIDQFNTLMAEAYKLNGWQLGAGRPTGKTTPIPTVVRVYTSVLRSGYRHQLKVWDYTSITTLREDLRLERAKLLRGSTTGPRGLDIPGVDVTDSGTLIGSVFHDLIVVYDTLPEADQNQLEASLDRLLKKFGKGTTLPMKPAPQPQQSARLH